MVMTSKLHREITSKPVRALHNDRTEAISGNTVQYSGEAGTVCNRVCAPDSLIVEPFHDDEAGRFGVAVNRFTLARFAVLALADVRRGAGAHVTYSLDTLSFAGHRLKPFL